MTRASCRSLASSLTLHGQIAKRVWSEGGATILDGAPLFRLRPDGHRSKYDCLHYGLPGPPDLWAWLLYNALSGRIV